MGKMDVTTPTSLNFLFASSINEVVLECFLVPNKHYWVLLLFVLVPFLLLQVPEVGNF
jgi:hypothetical protein